MYRYLLKYIKGSDFLVYSHDEEFVREVASTERFRGGDFDKIKYNLKKPEAFLADPKAYKVTVSSPNETLLSERKVFLLGRRAPDFEFEMPKNPSRIDSPAG